jgi:hypothetical protein
MSRPHGLDPHVLCVGARTFVEAQRTAVRLFAGYLHTLDPFHEATAATCSPGGRVGPRTGTMTSRSNSCRTTFWMST